MKAFKWIVAAAVAVSLTGCVIPADGSYDNNYDNNHHGKHHHHKDGNHHGYRQPAGDYESADGVRMITRDNVTLPDCEAVGGSQADNGSTCFYR